MKLYRADHAMIGRNHLNIGVTAIMKRVISLRGKLSDRPFGKVIVYRELTVSQKGKHTVPKTP